MTEDQRKMQEMYRREHIAEPFRGQSRYELIERIKFLETQLSNETEPKRNNNSSENSEDSKTPS